MPNFFKITKIIFLVGAFFLIGVVVFLKFDTKAAAELTDNVLRPVLGADRVIYLEKIFFNSSDFVERMTTNSNSISPPQFTDPGSDSTSNINGGDLDLKTITANNNFKSLADEGVWKDRPLDLFPEKEAMAYTFVRSDPNRPYSITTIVQMDMSLLKMGSVAGTKQPGGPAGNPGSGVVPKKIIKGGDLVAAFDGGFQYKDGEYGMIVGDKTYLPLKNDLATLVGYNDGSLKIVNYTGQSLGDNIAFVRQNCPILIENGDIKVTDPESRKAWGRLAKGTVDIYTWRSGIGLTERGNLLFAVGNNLTPETLAAALKEAGAVNAMQLDINPIWVRFNIFDYTGEGNYKSTTLTKELQDGSKQYLNGYEKDFFYLYKK